MANIYDFSGQIKP